MPRFPRRIFRRKRVACFSGHHTGTITCNHKRHTIIVGPKGHIHLCNHSPEDIKNHELLKAFGDNGDKCFDVIRNFDRSGRCWNVPVRLRDLAYDGYRLRIARDFRKTYGMCFYSVWSRSYTYPTSGRTYRYRTTHETNAETVHRTDNLLNRSSLPKQDRRTILVESRIQRCVYKTRRSQTDPCVVGRRLCQAKYASGVQLKRDDALFFHPDHAGANRGIPIPHYTFEYTNEWFDQVYRRGLASVDGFMVEGVVPLEDGTFLASVFFQHKNSYAIRKRQARITKDAKLIEWLKFT